MKKHRIIIAGDSLAHPRLGDEPISWQQVWPELLKNKLIEKNLTVEMLNHSVRGRTLPELVKNFTNVVSVWKPSILIFQIGIVDCAPRLFSQAEHKFLNSGLIHWRIARILIRFASKRRRKIISLRPNIRYTPINKFKIALENLKNKISQHKYTVIVLPIMPTFPSHAYRSPGYDEAVATYNQAWKQWCNNEEHIFIDWHEIIKEISIREVLLKDGHHLSVKGHELFANALLKKISLLKFE